MKLEIEFNFFNKKKLSLKSLRVFCDNNRITK